MHVYKIYINVVNEYSEKADCGSKKTYFHPNLSPKACTLSIQQSTLRICLKFCKGTTCKQN